MSVKVFQTNKAGKIEFTRCELEKLLNETYNEGYRDGEAHAKNTYWTWTSPSIINTTPYYGVTCLDTNSSKSIRDNNTAGTVTLNDSISNKADTCNASITATDSVSNKDEAKKISVQTHGELKDGKVDISTKVSTNDSPEKVYELKGIPYNVEDLTKTIDAILNGKIDLPTFPNSPFNDLAKELRGI